MAVNNKLQNTLNLAYSLKGFNSIFPRPIVALRAPTTADKANPGQLWVQPTDVAKTAVNRAWILTSIINNLSNWLEIEGAGGPGNFSSLVVTPGPVSLTGTTTINTAGAATTTIGNATAGAIIIGPSTVTGTFGVTGASTFTGATVVVGSFTQSGGNISMSNDAVASTAIFNTGAASKTTVIGSVNTTSATSILAGTGGLVLNSSSGATAGNVSMLPRTASTASPTAAVTMNNRVGVATFTGFTTAAAASQDFTITNSNILITSGMFVTVAARSAGNTSAMTIVGITQAAGSIVVHTTNNGAQALDSDVIITFWIIS